MKLAILGGGQLGKMFLQEATDYPMPVAVLDPDPRAPCAALTGLFKQGDFNDKQTVLDFAKDADAVGIEIEHVSVEALEALEEVGKRIIPSPRVLRLIKDKGLQKQFYADHKLPTAPFYLAEGKADIDVERIPLPFVQKTRTGGYDGKGVQVIVTEEDLPKLWDVPCVIEALCPITHEIAVIVATNGADDIVTYPVVEMVFDNVLNLVDYVQMPSFLNADIRQKAQQLAVQLVKSFETAGLFAIEMFITKNGDIWINETAPRVHNSGHLTIEACANSQYEQMWRLLTGMPLGSVQQYRPAAMINLIGAYGHSGPALLQGLETVLAMDETYVHWYGKAETRPGRKMGHITVLADHEPALKAKIEQIRKAVKVVSYH
ncbi:MAG: 5-(carboxyamino)imidazole ribonucleotide synthase [Cardiobacteriaceae bacterium]|nr:5-(carboxyamino)imidazole ribonucleotide synthase [Cardiobacteriaceae bacterium]